MRQRRFSRLCAELPAEGRYCVSMAEPGGGDLAGLILASAAGKGRNGFSGRSRLRHTLDFDQGI